MTPDKLRRIVSRGYQSEVRKLLVDGKCLFGPAGFAEIACQAYERAGSDKRIAGPCQTAEDRRSSGVILVSEFAKLALRKCIIRGLRNGGDLRAEEQAARGIRIQAVRAKPDNQRIARQIGAERSRCQIGKSVLHFGDAAIDRGCDQIRGILEPLQHALVLEGAILLKKAPAQPDHRAHRDQGRHQEQPRQFARQAHPRR